MEDYRARIRELKEENKRVKERADDNKSELRKEIKHLNEMIYKFEEENRKLKEELEKLEKELSAVYKAYHTALGVDYVSEEDLYDLND